MNNKFNETMKFEPPIEKVESVEEIILSVFYSLKERGYDPINQIIGYILSGDPTYITSHNNARSTICRIERDELLEELLKSYLDSRQ
ncbi:IreB family regulatory phosphoprotein [Tissierella praeacuta]|uniref:IreB family regulatory phosphoprotein n=1 Tax=Tissierella praeacuta TaxID=43131 RepID=UPI0033422645